MEASAYPPVRGDFVVQSHFPPPGTSMPDRGPVEMMSLVSGPSGSACLGTSLNRKSMPKPRPPIKARASWAGAGLHFIFRALGHTGFAPVTLVEFDIVSAAVI